MSGIGTVAPLVQLGALGVLALVLLLGFKFLGKLADRAGRSMDKQTVAIERLTSTLERAESVNTQRFEMLMSRLDYPTQPRLTSVRKMRAEDGR